MKSSRFEKNPVVGCVNRLIIFLIFFAENYVLSIFRLKLLMLRYKWQPFATSELTHAFSFMRFVFLSMFSFGNRCLYCICSLWKENSFANKTLCKFQNNHMNSSKFFSFVAVRNLNFIKLLLYTKWHLAIIPRL